MRQFFAFDSAAQKVPSGIAMLAMPAMPPRGMMSVGANVELLMRSVLFWG